jgi:hypothetical protein
VHLGYEAASALAALIMRTRAKRPEEAPGREMVRSGMSHHLKLPFKRLRPVSERPSRPDVQIIGGGLDEHEGAETSTQWPVPIVPIAGADAAEAVDEDVVDGDVVEAAEHVDDRRAGVLPAYPDEEEDQDEDEDPAVLHARFPDLVSLSRDSQHNFFTGSQKDQSTTGLFVATYSPVTIGDRFELVFTLPGVEGFHPALCEVIWTRDDDPEAPDTVPGMGLRFIELEERIWGAIEDFISEREPIFYEPEG